MEPARQVPCVYRHLLRAACASVRYSRTRARSLRQLLRADVRAAAASDAAECAETMQNTMALYVISALSHHAIQGPAPASGSAWRPSSSSAAADVASRVVYNLVSLAYHHLSPHTQMQPLTRRAGGSSTDTSKKASVVALALGDDDADLAALTSEAPRPALPVRTLHVAPKPVRGPLTHRPRYWDGQHPEKHLGGASSEELEALQARQAALHETHAQLADELGADHKRTKTAKQALDRLRSSVKGMVQVHRQRVEAAALTQCSTDALYDVVRAAAASERVWLGVPRWTAWHRGEFLPP